MKKVWAVTYGNYSPEEVLWLFATEELAQAQLKSIADKSTSGAGMWKVKPMLVHEEVQA